MRPALVPLIAGAVLLGAGLYALYVGRVLITWGRTVGRESVFYWIVVAGLLLLGIMNLVVALRVASRG